MSIGRSPHRYPLIVTNKHAWHINPQFLGLSVPLKIYQIIGLHPTLPSTSMQLGLMHRPGKWLCRNGITIHTGIPLFGTTLLFWLMSQRRDVLIIRWSRRMLRPVFLCLMVFVTYLDLCFFSLVLHDRRPNTFAPSQPTTTVTLAKATMDSAFYEHMQIQRNWWIGAPWVVLDLLFGLTIVWAKYWYNKSWVLLCGLLFDFHSEVARSRPLQRAGTGVFGRHPKPRQSQWQRAQWRLGVQNGSSKGVGESLWNSWNAGRIGRKWKEFSDGQLWSVVAELDFFDVGWRAFGRQLKKLTKSFLSCRCGAAFLAL